MYQTIHVSYSEIVPASHCQVNISSFTVSLLQQILMIIKSKVILNILIIPNLELLPDGFENGKEAVNKQEQR